MATIKAFNRTGPGRRTSRPGKFGADLIDALIKDMQDKRLPLDRVTITDEDTPGLRARIYESGTATFSIQYSVLGQKLRPTLDLGSYPELTVNEARNYARIINDLGKQGIDVRDGMLPRLLKELRRDGVKWRPK